jgi:hypothetical protein
MFLIMIDDVPLGDLVNIAYPEKNVWILMESCGAGPVSAPRKSRGKKGISHRLLEWIALDLFHEEFCGKGRQGYPMP